jgi:cell wall-associated NlpC family hydrolase
MVLPGGPAYVGQRRSAAVLTVALGCSFLAGCGAASEAPSDGPVASAIPTVVAPSATWSTLRLTDPARSRVLDANGTVLATFTDGARTVALHGPVRVFAEPATTSATVRSTTWVRLLPEPFDGRVDRDWLRRELRDTSPDILAVAMQYVTAAPQVRDEHGRVVAGDADFGPLPPDGRRTEGSDFNDYLGIPWSYSDGVDQPEPRERGSLDCSGFIRIVFGYRSGYPLALGPSTTALPRVATVMMSHGPGVAIERDRGVVPSPRRLQPGDLLFFDHAGNDGVPFNHSGIYLGRDRRGHPRFVSSRRLVNGPSMGDAGEESVLTGVETRALRWRAARRV